MKTQLALVIFLVSFTTLYAQKIRWDWTYIPTGTGESYLTRITVTEDQEVYAMGQFSGEIILGADTLVSEQENDIFIFKLSNSGKIQWACAVTSDNVFGRGSLAVDSKDNLYVVLSYTGNLSVGTDSYSTSSISEGFIAKYSGDGDFLWSKPIDAPRSVFELRVGIDAQDSIYVAGNFTGGSIALGGKNISGPWHEYSCVLFYAKMDSSGNTQWIRSALMYETMDVFGLVDMIIDEQGNGYLTGTIGFTSDFGDGVVVPSEMESPFIVKYSPQGKCLWGIPGKSKAGFGESCDLSMGKSGMLNITGMYLMDLQFDTLSISAPQGIESMSEIFLVQLDSTGSVKKLFSYGSLGGTEEIGLSYAELPNRDGYLLGLFGDTLVMGEDSLVAVEDPNQHYISSNIFLARLDENGQPVKLWSAGLHGDRQFGEIQVFNNFLYMAGYSTQSSSNKGFNEQSIRHTAFLGSYNTQLDTAATFPEEPAPYTPCLKGDKIEWNYLSDYQIGDITFTLNFLLDKDTIINNLSYKKISLTEKTGLIYPEFIGYMREDTIAQKLWFLPKDMNTEQLYMDFDLALGDSFAIMVRDRLEWRKVKAVSTTDNKKTILFDDDHYFREGIGSDWSPLYFNNSNVFSSILLCAWNNNLLLYQNSYYHTCDTTIVSNPIEVQKPLNFLAPNPFSNYIQQKKGAEFRIRIYNLQGILFIDSESGIINTQRLPKGIYIAECWKGKELKMRQKLVKE